MHKLAVTCWTFLLSVCVPIPARAAPARVWEAPLVLPTYELGPADPNPAFFTGHRPPMYPYTRLDDLTGRRGEKTWKAVYLENEYLRVTVLPEMGGKLYSIFDKTANREVLYTNHVVKYGLVAIRGAWTSGGIEWNFPNGHTVTGASPIDYVLATAADGTASVTVGDTERIQRMQWQVAIRLRPGSKAVETEVTLNNRRDIPGRYWFWATAAAPATDDMRFVYPMREAYPHAFWPIFSFPTYHGLDLSLYREVPNALSLFARNSARDFMGIYYEKSDHGVIHVADHRLLPGKKTWTWGTEPAGAIWIDKLTDSDGQYVEFQAGRFETQMEHEFLAPRTLERFTEYWYPVDRLGGPFSEATQNGALRVTNNENGASLRVSGNVNARCAEGRVAVGQVADLSKPFASLKLALDPAAPFAVEIPLPADRRGQPLEVALACGAEPLVTWRSDTPLDGNPDFKPATPPPPKTESAFDRAVAQDKSGHDAAARAAYEQAGNSGPARLGLAIVLLRNGQYDRAAAALEPLATAEAHYYLGLARRGQGRLADAITELTAALSWDEPLVRAVLGETMLAAGQIEPAGIQLAGTVRLTPTDLKARTALALAERAGGKLDAAQSTIDAVCAELPLDYLALRERELVLKARGKDAEAARLNQELWRLLAREPDSALELAFDYGAAGFHNDAIAVLKEARERSGYPLIRYTLGYLLGRAGDTAAAQSEYTAAAQADPAYVFPHRPEEIAVLAAARSARPQDGRAAYYLGNALAGNARFAEAVAAWRDAVRLDPSNAVAHRNLASALARDSATRPEAVREYRRALELAPSDWRLYLELDSALRPDTAARVALLEGSPAALRVRPAIKQALAAAYTDQGRFEDALALLKDTPFVSGEGDVGPHQIYRRAHTGLADKYRASGDRARAAEEILAANEFPANLGVGKPAFATPARDLVTAAGDFEAAGLAARAEPLWKLAAEGPLVSPTDPGAHLDIEFYYQALALEHLGRKDAARAVYERLAAADRDELAPGGAAEPMLMGLGLKALGRDREAAAAFERCLKLDPARRECRAAK
jgi:tetratricopeptide (TPR) repeat protein